MKIIKRVPVFLLICSFMLFIIPQTVLSTPSINVNYAPLEITNTPYLQNQRVMVEFRSIFEALELQVDWFAKTQKVIAKNNQLSIELTINENIAYVNDEMVILDAAPKVSKGRTMVPVRFVSETTGATVDWNGQTKTVDIFTNGPNYIVSVFEKEFVRLTNVERRKYNLKPLILDQHLSQIARLKSLDFVREDYFSHDSPTYGSPFDMMRSFDIDYRRAGEIIAGGQITPEEVVTAWMDSPGHRRNILQSEYTHIGIGYVQGGYYSHYWTQMFVKYFE